MNIWNRKRKPGCRRTKVRLDFFNTGRHAHVDLPFVLNKVAIKIHKMRLLSALWVFPLHLRGRELTVYSQRLLVGEHVVPEKPTRCISHGVATRIGITPRPSAECFFE